MTSHISKCPIHIPTQTLSYPTILVSSHDSFYLQIRTSGLPKTRIMGVCQTVAVPSFRLSHLCWALVFRWSVLCNLFRVHSACCSDKPLKMMRKHAATLSQMRGIHLATYLGRWDCWLRCRSGWNASLTIFGSLDRKGLHIAMTTDICFGMSWRILEDLNLVLSRELTCFNANCNC